MAELEVAGYRHAEDCCWGPGSDRRTSLQLDYQVGNWPQELLHMGETITHDI